MVYVHNLIPRVLPQQSGAVEACWAHNPEVRGSKPRSAKKFFFHEHILIILIVIESFLFLGRNITMYMYMYISVKSLHSKSELTALVSKARLHFSGD